MKRKNIFKTLTLAMLMPAMLLTTACSNDDEAIVNNETTNKKGFEIPVTINVTRQGDATTRANYNETSKKLEFSTGDQLWFRGENDGGAGVFTALLTWQSGGKFSGNLYTQNEYKGTVDALLTVATDLQAYLLPAGYSTYGFLSFYEGLVESHNAILAFRDYKAFALTKAEAVEQFTLERATSYSGGFALSPTNPILSFTITGLAASTVVAVNYESPYAGINQNVTTDASGKATFALAAAGCTNTNQFTLTVGGNAITLGSHALEAGKIYNITRSAAPAATSLSELKTAINGGTDCSSYIGWEVNSAGAIAESGISGTKIGYVAYVSTSDVDAGVSGSRILVIASADAGTSILWGSYGTSRGLTADDLNGYSNTNTLQGYGSEAHPAAYAAWNYSATIPSGGATPAHWFMPTKKQWENMRGAKGGTYNAMAAAYGISGHYWTSTEVSNNNAWRFVTNSNIQSNMKSLNYNVRSVFAY